MTKPDDNDVKGIDDDNYAGEQIWGCNLACTLCTACATGQKLVVAFAPSAFIVLEEVLDSMLPLSEESGFVKCSASTKRGEACRNLLGVSMSISGES